MRFGWKLKRSGVGAFVVLSSIFLLAGLTSFVPSAGANSQHKLHLDETDLVCATDPIEGGIYSYRYHIALDSYLAESSEGNRISAPCSGLLLKLKTVDNQYTLHRLKWVGPYQSETYDSGAEVVFPEFWINQAMSTAIPFPRSEYAECVEKAQAEFHVNAFEIQEYPDPIGSGLAPTGCVGITSVEFR